MTSVFKPRNYSTASPYLIVNGANATIDFLVKVFGAAELRRFAVLRGSSCTPRFGLTIR